MNKQEILSEIRRTAASNGGRPLGRLTFENETGIREYDWQLHWARWNDAILEAGLIPNQKTIAFEDKFLIEKIIALCRELGHFPVNRELSLKARNDPTFPSEKTFRRFGSKLKFAAELLSYCKERPDYDDVKDFCETVLGSELLEPTPKKRVDENLGYVYLIKSGRYHKIGRSNAVGRRERELAIQLPDKAKTIHSIHTDDPTGIEAYWHKRFERKRKNGEWFDLSSEEVRAFKRRKFM